MNRNYRLKKMVIFLFASWILVSGLVLGGCGGGDGNLRNGSPAPNFQLQNLDGKPVSLKDYRGKMVLVNFWSSTCGPCVQEMPYFQAIFTKWSHNSEVALLTIDIGESSSTVQKFMQDNNYTFPVLLDGKGEVTESYGVRYTPTTCFIDKEGNLKSLIIGGFKDQAAIEKKAVEFGFTLN